MLCVRSIHNNYRCFCPAPDGAATPIKLLGVAAVCQLGLGIATLLSMVEISRATLHQAGAMTVFALAI